MRIKPTAFFALLIFCLWPVQFLGPSAATATRRANTVYLFVEIEAMVYRTGVKLNGEVSRANYETRAEAEEQRTKEIEYRKNQSGNIYSFELVFEGPAKGEETSKPKLIYRDKEQPNYGSAK